MEKSPTWQAFADFSALDMISGGPDSHMTTITHMSKNLPLEERAWWALVYVSVYNVPMALAILQKFPTHHDTASIRSWVTEHWRHIVLRRERKRVLLSPAKLVDCLESCAMWLDVNRLSSAASYEDLWADAEHIRYFGRYAKIKSLEALRRVGAVHHMIPDLRARDAKSPRQGLALLWPEHTELLNYGGNSPEVLTRVEDLASRSRDNLLYIYDVDLDTYCFQTLICDFKQVVITKRQYPGRSVDSELQYHAKVSEHFLIDNTMFIARAELFPKWALGELRGWPGVREELGKVFTEYGYLWSDYQFDYLKTIDLAHPVAA